MQQIMTPHAPVLPARAGRSSSRAAARGACAPARHAVCLPRAAAAAGRPAALAPRRRCSPALRASNEAEVLVPRPRRMHAPATRLPRARLPQTRPCPLAPFRAFFWRCAQQRNPERLSFCARRCHAQSLAAPAVDENVLEYCDISKRTRTLGEKEQDFLMALQSFYDTGECRSRLRPRLASGAAPARRRAAAPRPTCAARRAAPACRP
jgi:hypothetical protein